MTTQVVILSHNEIGSALLEATRATLGGLPLPTLVFRVTYETDPDVFLENLTQSLEKLKAVDGFLILTDLYGSTPSNIANALRLTKPTQVISGINLPMLIRLMNYPKLDLTELALKARSGGKEGIFSQGDT